MLLLPLLLALSAPAPEAPARTVMLTRFDRLRVSGPYVVEVITGGRTGAELLGNREAAELVDVRVDSGLLTIQPAARTQDAFQAARAPATIRVRTTAPLQAITLLGGGKLSADRLAGARAEVALNGTGSLTVAGIAAEQLVATLVGSGTLTLAGSARQARVAASGSGSVDAAALDARELMLRQEGAGEGRFRARFTADVTANGAGSVTVEGTPKCQVRGTAAVRCGED